ncbi:hypothetical protein PPL_01631 [Heterostelium album PN500]|uniref:HTH cro/C1-type domain-containing protein n=1 Tax=Heterostelium pallidum (strain ATCC 26659 / Pp 5 / PN500) TaxID=670386 RepID=D3B017_HETP5|nr:hypothetical protein PPL_01631 [Heterostelium album PN500]EFA84641.1 hypothetical protein PPL_01631 [Heterostelium album PN500]|eukprot:XP_020436754.1 hypothetical protein PPL_01631 [Heterostelium album PN500]
MSEIAKKYNAGTNKGSSQFNAKKIEEEEESIKIPELKASVPKAIQKARTQLGMNQKELAAKIYETTSVVNSYENGSAIPSVPILIKMEKVLGVKLRGKDIGTPLKFTDLLMGISLRFGQVVNVYKSSSSYTKISKFIIKPVQQQKKIGMMILDSEETVHFELEEDFDGMEYPEKSKYGWAYNRIPLTNAQWLYIFGAQGVVSGIINFFINMFLAWVIYPKGEGATIVFTGSLTCIFSDIIMTSFLLPTITCILSSFLVTFDLRKGKMISPIDERWLKHPCLSWIPTVSTSIHYVLTNDVCYLLFYFLNVLGINYKIIIKRAIIFGVLGVCVFSPPTLVAVFLATKSDGYMVLKWSFYIFKGIWCALLAMIVSPLIAFVLVASYALHCTSKSTLTFEEHNSDG